MGKYLLLILLAVGLLSIGFLGGVRYQESRMVSIEDVTTLIRKTYEFQKDLKKEILSKQDLAERLMKETECSPRQISIMQTFLLTDPETLKWIDREIDRSAKCLKELDATAE